VWDERYGGDDYAYGEQPNDYLVEMAHFIPAGGEVLCLAEGEGRNAVWLAQQGYRVTAMDASPVGMEKARALAARREVDVTLLVSDLVDYDIGENRWDGIVLIWVHLPPGLRHTVLSDCVRGLKSGGILISESYGLRQLEYGTGGPRQRELLTSLEEVTRELPGLHLLHAEETDREVLEGKHHTGMAAVVQVTARR
jgi:SAM-dependent methyltransferase